MALLHIREAVLHVSDLPEAVRFHVEAFGLDVLERGDDETLLGVRGVADGRIRIVARPDVARSGPGPRLWDLGPRLLGIYSHDLDATVEAMRAAGGAPRTPVTYPYGQASLSELVAEGVEGVWWTVPLAVPGAHRPSDAYDADPERLHSELHTAVLVVDPDGHDAARAFFEAGGLETVFDGSMAGEPFDELTGMPVDASLRLTFMGGEGHRPARFEIMSFTGVDAVDRSGDDLGLVGLVHVCDDVAATRRALLDAGAEEIDARTLRGPLGIRLTLVEQEEAR